jgi:hypothetical protein
VVPDALAADAIIVGQAVGAVVASPAREVRAPADAAATRRRVADRAPGLDRTAERSGLAASLEAAPTLPARRVVRTRAAAALLAALAGTALLGAAGLRRVGLGPDHERLAKSDAAEQPHHAAARERVPQVWEGGIGGERTGEMIESRTFHWTPPPDAGDDLLVNLAAHGIDFPLVMRYLAT